MVIKIDNYEVKINAREVGNKTMNKKDTYAFLSALASTYAYASAWARRVGYKSIANKLDDDFLSIYDAAEGMMKQGY